MINTIVFSQYLHLSNTFGNPISFIHSEAGNELRATQLGLVYRDQGNRAGKSHYKRIHFFGQRNLTNNFGLGFTFNNLTAGAGRSQYLNANLAVPYHLRISALKSHRISIAPVGSFLQLRQGGEDLRFEENILGTGGSDVNSFGKQQAFQYGASLSTHLDFHKFNIQLGYEYLTKANTRVGVLLHDLHKILLKSSINSIFKNTDFNTTVLYQKSANEHLFHILPSIRINNISSSFNAFDVGVGYRLEDGFTFLIGTEINNKYQVYFNYDYTTSGLVALNNGNGALELGISYKFYKTAVLEKPKSLPIVLPIQKFELPNRIHVLTPLLSDLTYLPLFEDRKSVEVLATNEVKRKDVNIDTITNSISQQTSPIPEYGNVKTEDNSIDTISNNESIPTISETKSFLFYHDVNIVPIKSLSQKELYTMIDFLKRNKERIVSIDIISFTDSKGTDNYNIGISGRRAAALKSIVLLYYYIETNVTWGGKGETNLTNDCYDGVDCIEPEHNVNRRTQVKINLR